MACWQGAGGPWPPQRRNFSQKFFHGGAIMTKYLKWKNYNFLISVTKYSCIHHSIGIIESYSEKGAKRNSEIRLIIEFWRLLEKWKWSNWSLGAPTAHFRAQIQKLDRNWIFAPSGKMNLVKLNSGGARPCFKARRISRRWIEIGGANSKVE